MPDGAGAQPAGARRRSPGALPGGYTLFLIAVSVLAAALVLAREVTHGPALHWDTINYLAVARNLLAGEGFLNYDGTPYTLWPPLYPLLLAAAGFGVLDPLQVVGPLNAGILGLTVFVVGRYLRRRLESRFLAVWAPVVMALSLPLTDMAWWGLSETLFVLLATLALIGADDFLREGRRSSSALAAVSASLALLTRYLGIGVVAVTAIAVLFRTEDSPGTRARRFLLVGLVGVGPTAPWLFRNLRLTGEFTGGQPPPAGGLQPDLLRDLVGGLESWTRFEWHSPALLPTLLLAALVAVLAARRESVRGPTGDRATDRGSGWRPAALFGGFALAHAVALAAAGTLAGIDFQARYLDVAYPAFVVAAVCALDRLLASERERRRLGDFSGRGLFRLFRAPGAPAPTRLAVLLPAALTFGAAGLVAPQARAIAHANSADLVLDRGYHAAPWNRIEALAAVREHPGAEPVFTNLPPIHRVVLHHARGGRGTIRGLPLREAAAGAREGESEGSDPDRNADAPEPTPPTPASTPTSTPASTPSGDRLRVFFAGAPEGALVLWLGAWSSERLYDYGRAALRLLPDLEPVAEFADGALFRVRRAPAAGPGSGSASWRAAYESAAAAAPRAAPGADRTGSATGFEARIGYAALPGFEGAALTYRREPCGEEHPRARFFLHLYPEAVGDLPAERREPGFGNHDFRFAEYGAVLDRESSSPKCVAIVPLPGYPFRRLRTGQWTAAEGEHWAAEIVPGAAPAADPAGETPPAAAAPGVVPEVVPDVVANVVPEVLPAAALRVPDRRSATSPGPGSPVAVGRPRIRPDPETAAVPAARAGSPPVSPPVSPPPAGPGPRPDRGRTGRGKR